MTGPDILAVLKRSDQRWTARTCDDPADPAYLEHLAAALQSVGDQTGLPPASAADQVNQLRVELAAAKRQAENHRSRSIDADQAICDRDQARFQLEGTQLALEEARQDAAGWKAAHDGRAVQHAELEQQLAEMTSAAKAARWERDEAHEKLIETASALEALVQARDAASDQLRALQAEQPAVAELTNLLGRLVDAITTQWQPDGDLTGQVDLAVELVTAASAQIAEWHAKAHVHQYPRDPATGHIGKCACGKRIPKSARNGLTTANRGVA